MQHVKSRMCRQQQVCLCLCHLLHCTVCLVTHTTAFLLQGDMVCDMEIDAAVPTWLHAEATWQRQEPAGASCLQSAISYLLASLSGFSPTWAAGAVNFGVCACGLPHPAE